MSRGLRVRATVIAANPALSHVLTGFILLRKSGIVDLTLDYRPDLAGDHPSASILDTVVDDRIRVAYDVEDGYIFDWATRERHLETVDVCFKRSYDPVVSGRSAFADRVRPLGLMYPCVAPDPLFGRLRRAKPRAYLKTMAKKGLGRDMTPYWWRFEGVPRRADHPRVLFAARTWDPDGEPGETIGDRTEAHLDRHPINEMRADCVRLLRSTFGDRFVGGLAPTAHAKRCYPDCLMTPAMSRRPRFVAAVHRSDVCVATRGLFGSNGFKLGEYVAGAKAVVSEGLRYAVPGDFTAGRNYLEFDTPDRCAEQVERLLTDADHREAMALANYRYYQESLRPDRLVLKTLLTALEAGRDAAPRDVPTGPRHLATDDQFTGRTVDRPT